MAYGKIRITRYHESATVFNLFVDDIDISKYTRSVKIEMNAGNIPEVWVLLIGSVEIPEDIKAMITVEKQEDRIINHGELTPVEKIP